MSYRKVTYLEQMWYILKFYLKERRHKHELHSKKTDCHCSGRNRV